jgi:hypothetical protein
MSGRALESELEVIHGLVAEILSNELKAAKTAEDPINPQLLEKAMKFLSMNGVTAPASSKRVSGLAEQLASLNLEDDEDAFQSAHH